MINFSVRFTLLFSLTVFSISAQQSSIYNRKSNDLDKAISLYNNEQYASAQLLFESLANNSEDQDLQADYLFYIASCAIRTNQPNGGKLMERFISSNPTSPLQNQANSSLAQYYFTKGNYSEALNYLEKVDESGLASAERERFNFQKGYSYFNAKNKQQATTYLNRVLNSKVYGTQAKYYLGFMAYEGDDYKQATKYFDQVSDDEEYKEKLSYYQADMSFKSGNFQKAIDLGTKALSKSNTIEKSELNKIIGESYFNLKQYEKSIPYLAAYKGKKGKWNNTDFYQLGYSYYMKKDYEIAISQFNKIINGKDFVAQNAYYHLGESYLKVGKKQEALNAFKNASEMDFNKEIQEDAALNYAKLSYEQGNSYQSTPTILSNFIKKYPNSASKDEVEKLLIDSYVSSKNYKDALLLLENNKIVVNKLAYQKVTFYYGLELYQSGKFDLASLMFEKSILQHKDPLLTARATFWNAETFFSIADFKNAILSYREFLGLTSAKDTPEFKNINYNIAFANFKLKDYEQASQYFKNQIGTVKDDKSRLTDSYLRLADCQFVTAKYREAIDTYSKAIELKSVDADYARYQQALSYGFSSQNDKKVQELNSFLQLYSKSVYRDDAYFELANTYVAQNKRDLALATYDKLISEFSKGAYTSKAILRQGLVYYNADQDDQALQKFKKIAADFPKSSEALEAVSTARLIYLDKGRVDEYTTWVKNLNFVVVTDAELDNDTYEAAEKQYLQNNYTLAIASFKSYTNSFPNGMHALKANFYLAQALYSQKQEKNAIPNYEYVIKQARSEFTEQSLSRLGQIYLNAGDRTKAITILTRLENEAELSQNKTFAQANLMKLYYENKDNINAAIFAEKVLGNPKAETNVKSDAQIIIARSAFQSGDLPKARAAYTKLQSVAKGELAAEALYYEAYFKNTDGKYEESNTLIQKIAKNYSSYKYFGAKGLIVMAKNFYGLKDSYQATYILENVIQNFADFADITAEAKTELQKIKTEESKTNSSVSNQ